MRIRCLLFTLVLLGSATPLHASLGVAPQCVPLSSQAVTETAGAKSLLLPALHQTIPSYDAEDRDYMIRTIAFEAPDEPDEGKAAVAYVILNREKSGRWGDTIKDVVTHPWQFEPWMTKRKEMEDLSTNESRYREAARIADAVLSGEMPDPTVGATHFLNPTVVRQRRGGSLPAWARGEGQPIGRHTFYTSNEAAYASNEVALLSGPASTDALDNSLACAPQEAVDAPYVGLMTLADSGTEIE